MEDGLESQQISASKMVERIVGRESSRGSGSTVCNESKACRKVRQQRRRRGSSKEMRVVKDMTKNIRSKGRMETVSCWPLIAKQRGWEDTVLRWYNWLFEMKRNMK